MDEADPLAVLFALGDGKFEWVDGQIIEHPPVSAEECDIRSFLRTILYFFAEEREGGIVHGGGYLNRLDSRTVRAPDVAFFRQINVGKITPTHSQGAADLVAEIVSLDSRKRDRSEKFFEYEKAGIEEYWIIDPESRTAEFFRLQEGVYQPVLPDDDGKACSSVLPGFYVRIEWLWNRPKILDAAREFGVI